MNKKSDSDIAIDVQNVSKKYLLGTGISNSLRDTLASLFRKKDISDFWVLKNINFKIKKGEVVGIIGSNGAGKSTLLKILSKITAPTKGKIIIKGRIASLLEVGTGFHPELTGMENVFLNGALLGLKNKEIQDKLDEIIEFSGVGHFIDVPIKKYSSGMYVRLAFAVAAHLEPDILLIDEVLSVGDHEFQQKCLGKMNDISKSGRTVVIVSHNLSLIGSLAHKIFTIKNGEIHSHENVAHGIKTYIENNSSQSKDYAGDIINNIDFVTEDQNNNLISTGKDLQIDFTYKTKIKYTNLYLRFEIKNSFGDLMFMCNSRISGDKISSIQNQGVLSCYLKHIPLMEGTYFLDYKMLSNQVEIDKSKASLSFYVTNSNFYKTGLEPQMRKGVLINYSFTNTKIENEI